MQNLFAGIQRGKALKKVDAKDQKDRSAPQPKAQMEQIRESRQASDYANVEKWAEGIEDFIIPAYLLPLSYDQGCAIIHQYELNYNVVEAPLTEVEQQHLNQLANQIEAEVKKHFDIQRGFFIRLNTRSPKDGRIMSDELKTLVADEITKAAEVQGIPVSQVSDNTKLGIVYTNQVFSLLVKSGREAVDLLCSSMRIWEDIKCQRSASIGASDFAMLVCVREWARIHPKYEFRGFVFNRSLNCVSSYNRCVYWPGVPEQQHHLARRIQAYWAELEPHITPSIRNCICDFAFTEDLQRIIVVELNQFNDYEGNATNAELFDWKEDEDVIEGRAPFEMRVVEQPLTSEQLESTLTTPYKMWLGWIPFENYDPTMDHV